MLGCDTGSPIGIDEAFGLTSGSRCWYESHIRPPSRIAWRASFVRERERKRRRERKSVRSRHRRYRSSLIFSARRENGGRRGEERRRKRRRRELSRSSSLSKCRCYANSRFSGFTSPRTLGTTTRCTTARLRTRYSKTTSEYLAEDADTKVQRRRYFSPTAEYLISELRSHPRLSPTFRRVDGVSH